MIKVESLGYYGSKKKGKAKWINSILPEPKRGLAYMETHGGMAGVLLDRDPKGVEILNDLNGRCVNWFRCMRDKPDELGRLIDYTPYSYDEYVWGLENLDNEELSDVYRALAYHLVVWLSVVHSDSDKLTEKQFSRNLSGNVGSNGKWSSDRVHGMAKRLHRVYIYNEDAVGLLSRTKEMEHIIAYIDPPYGTADTSPYRYSAINHDGIKDSILDHNGYVAVSGYNDEWDDLGWNYYTFETISSSGVGKSQRTKRLEKLWVNERLDEDYKGRSQANVLF